MDSEYEGIPTDPIASRTQSYMWLVEALATVADGTERASLVAEGLVMLAAIRTSITIHDKPVLKGIRGGS